MKERRNSIRSLGYLLCLICGIYFLFLLLDLHSWPYRIENLTLDRRLQQGKAVEEDPNLVYLGFDLSIADTLFPEDIAAEPILQKMEEQWPWDRSVWAQAIERLLQAEAKVVAVDIVFNGASPEHDPSLRRLVERYPDRIVLGIREESSEAKGRPSTTISPISPFIIPDSTSELFEPSGRLGFVNILLDQDRIVRRYLYQATGFHMPTIDAFATKVLRKAGYQELIEKLPPSPMLHFAPLKSYQPIMLWDLFLEDSWRRNFAHGKFFKDKIVIIGPYGSWSNDQHATSISSTELMDGPKIHLNAISAAIHDNFISEATTRELWICFLLAFLLPICIFASIRNRTWCFLIWISGNFCYLLFSLAIYSWGSHMNPLFFPLLAWNACWIILISTETILSWIEKKQLRSTLNRYLSKEVAQHLISSKKDSYFQALGGVRREAVVLFSDLRNFTTLSENYPPVELVTLLNSYLTEMVAEIFRQKGRLDKFMGDAVMAVWGDLQESQNSKQTCEQAVRAAIGMIGKLKWLNQQWQKEQKPSLQMGIGIHCGELVFGNLGSEHRMELTVIGDTVNLGSRLEGETKKYQQPLLVSREVMENTAELFAWRSVDIVQVKGRRQAVEIYTLNPELPEQSEPWLDLYHQAVQQFRRGEQQFGKALWQKLSQQKPDDFLIKTYASNSEQLLAGKEWKKQNEQIPLLLTK